MKKPTNTTEMIAEITNCMKKGWIGRIEFLHEVNDEMIQTEEEHDAMEELLSETEKALSAIYL